MKPYCDFCVIGTLLHKIVTLPRFRFVIFPVYIQETASSQIILIGWEISNIMSDSWVLWVYRCLRLLFFFFLTGSWVHLAGVVSVYLPRFFCCCCCGGPDRWWPRNKSLWWRFFWSSSPLLAPFCRGRWWSRAEAAGARKPGTRSWRGTWCWWVFLIGRF